MPRKLDAPIIMATALTASLPGQNHDPLNHKDGLSIQNMLPNEDVFAPSGEPADITPFQKMLSATTGSLITGLTSMQNTLCPVRCTGTRLTAGSDTT